jgi:hypothetical protein
MLALAFFLRREPAPAAPEPKSPSSAPVVGHPGDSRLASVPPAPVPRPGPPSAPSSLKASLNPDLEAHLRRAFQELRKAHHQAILEHGLTGGFFSDRLLFRREARLFAAAYPDLAEAVASVDVRDTSLDWRERLYAVDLLGFLAAGGRSSVLSLLRALSNHEDEFIKAFALSGIAMADVDGSEKALYWAQCRAGSATAFAFVALWPDSGTISEMHALESTIAKLDAEDVLAKIEMLQQPDWKERLGRIVRGERSPLDDPVDWALGCLQRRAPEELRTLLRAELDSTGDRARRWWAQQQPGGAFEKDFQVADAVSFATGRKDYDRLLVTQWLIGGELTDAERRRLREFGYASDPAVRLAELFAPK